MRQWVAVVSVMVVVALASLGACSDDDVPTAPDETPTEPAGDDVVDDVDGDDDVAVGTFPTRAPEVTGRLQVVDEAVRLADASDAYYAEMTLLAPDRDDAVLVVDEGGNDLAVSDLEDGMLVDVYVGGPCAESFPVQCDIEALRVDLAS